MQSIMSVIMNMNESKLKRKGYRKLLIDLEQKKSRLRLQRSDVGQISKRFDEK